MSTGSQGNSVSSSSPSGRSQQPSLTGTVAELSSPKTHRVQNALILIRTRFLKEKDGIARLRQRGGLPKLLQILVGKNEKLVDITLSILGNCCMESKTRQEILEVDGIEKIAKLLEKTAVESIRNRVCRTLANLALDPECCALMHETEELEIVKNVVKLLKDSTDAECQQTYLRTLRLLADSKIHERMVLEEGALRASALLLKSEDCAVIMASLKTVNHFTKQITEEHCLQLVGGDGPAALISLVSNPDENISGSARSLILTFIKCELLRPPFGAAGIIPFFLQNVEGSTLNSQKFSYVNALCLCCRESVNRVRIRESGTLVLLVDWLNDSTFAPIHYRIISSLVCFLYDEVGMELLLNHSIVPTLVKHLKRCARIPDCATGKTETEMISCCMEDVSVEAIEDCQKDLDPVIVLPSSTDPLQLESCGQVEGSSEAVQRDPLEEKKEEEEEKAKEQNEQEDKSQAAEEADASVNKRGATKYSIDSPTYKEMMENRNDDDSYYTGPRNIMESAQYYSGVSSSPEKMSPYRSPHHGGSYSPLSVSSYLASDWSPEISPSSSPTRSHSPVISFCSQDSTGSQGPFSNSGAPSVTLPLWSSTQGSSPSASQQSNLSYISPMSSPPHPQASPPIFRSSSSPSFWSPVHSVTYHPQFSSEEDEDDAEDEEGEGESQHRNVTFQVGDNAPSLPLDEDLFPAVPALHSASPQPSTSGKQGNRSDDSAGGATSSLQQKTGRKRRHSLSLELQRNIRRKVEADSRSSSVVSLESLIADAKSIKFEKTEGELSKIKGPRKITEYNILVLLSRISCMDNPSQYMGSSILWTALLNYVRFAQDPIQRAGKLMIRLTKNPDCFPTLVLSMVPELIDRLLCSEFDDTQKELSDEAIKVPATKPVDHVEINETVELSGEKRTTHNNNTRQLRDQLLGSLSIMAESRYGRGTLTSVLLRKSEMEQLRCTVSLPFICRSVSLREDLLLNCGALMVLLERLLQPRKREEEMKDASVTFEMLVHSVRELAHKADLPSFATSSWGSKIAFHSSVPPVTFDLTFVLDDGCQVKGQRQVMVSRSSVFKAMLQGYYSESGQSEINIPDVSPQAFQIFIDLVHGSSIEVPSFIRENLDTHLEVSLEILGLCNRFLVLELQQKVSEYICDHVLNVACAVDIIEFALVHNSTWLLRQGLCYVLSKSVSFQEAVLCFQELASTHHSAHIIKELKTILS